MLTERGEVEYFKVLLFVIGGIDGLMYCFVIIVGLDVGLDII